MGRALVRLLRQVVDVTEYLRLVAGLAEGTGVGRRAVPCATQHFNRLPDGSPMLFDGDVHPPRSCRMRLISSLA
jgi:hypothetical protein